MSSATESQPPQVRFGLRPDRGLLLGLSSVRVAAVGGAAVLIVAGLVTAGAVGLAATSLLWVPLLVSTFANWRARPVIDWAPTFAHWALRSSRGQTRYRARLLEPRPAGTMALPGDAAALRFYTDPESGACMIHDPHRQTLSAVIRATHAAYILLSPEQQRSRVAAWGRVLSGLAPSGTCACIQILESTVSDRSEAIAAWYDQHRSGSSGWADEQYRQLLSGTGAGATTHISTITLSLDMRRAAKAIRDGGRGLPGTANVLRGDMHSLEFGLREAELRLQGWLDEDDLSDMVSQAYDPNPVTGPARSSPTGLAGAGPTAIDERWDCLRHDSGWSTVLWVSQWPRIEVPAHFLHGLIFAPGVRKSICLLARPLTTADALRQIRKEKTEMMTDAATRSRIGQIADLSDSQQFADVAAREQALVCGHADLAYSGFVTVTAATRSELDAAVAQIERAATGAACETRIVYGAQAQAFTAAALPLGRSTL